MKNFILFLLLAVIPAACISNDALDGLNLTTSDYLVEPPGLASPDVIVIPKKSFPPEIADSEKFKGKEIVIAPDNLVKAGAPKIDFVIKENEGGIAMWFLEMGTLLAGVGASFFPQLAILEAIFIAMSKRKRQHYADAVKAAVPYDGNVDLKHALISLLKAFGLKHSQDSANATPPAPPPQA
jgi:hypothetical protein